MTDINFKVNGQKYILGIPWDEETLKENDFKKMGPIKAFLTNQSKADKIYWIKNPLIKCLESVGFCPLQENIKEMYGTSVFLSFSDKRLSRIFFQVIGNKLYSKSLARYFVKKATENFGEPIIETEAIVKWTLEGSVLICDTRALSNTSFSWTIQA